MKAKNILLFTCLLWMLASCTSTHKVKQSVTKKIDSTSTSTSQASGKHNSDSSTQRLHQETFKEGLTIQFGDEDATTRAQDLAGPVDSVSIDGKVIKSARPIKSITVTSSGKTSTIDMAQLRVKDSGHISVSNKVAVAKEEEDKSMQLERHGANPLIWIFLGIALIAAVWFGFRFALFKKVA